MGRILRSVLRPEHVDPHYASRRKLRWWGGGERITVGQARVTGTEPTLGWSSLDVARLAPDHCPRKRVSWPGRTGRRSRPPSQQGSREPGFGCPHVVYVVAEVGRRHRVSNTLVKRASKKAAGASEQKPSLVSVSAGETAGVVSGRKERRRSWSLARNAGWARQTGPGWREIVIQRLQQRQKR